MVPKPVENLENDGGTGRVAREDIPLGGQPIRRLQIKQ